MDVLTGGVPSVLGELDLHLIGEGRHEELWRALGGRTRTVGGVAGASFAVWAPGAREVRLVGDLNGWDGAGHALRRAPGGGLWELFVPGAGDGCRYMYEITGADGRARRKADPLALAAEHPPRTASVVFTSRHRWRDGAWLAARGDGPAREAPMSVYELHLGSWRRGLTYRDLAEQLPGYLRGMGFTHAELMPVAEHPFGGSWGYQISSYYAPSSRYGTPDDFRALVEALHLAGIGVILDWVPAHFPRDDWALARFDGGPLYEHPDPLRGEHPDWGTLTFDLGRPEVRNFLIANALYWCEEFHVDALRVDAVASMLYLDYSRPDGAWRPNAHGGREHLEAIAFLRELNDTVHRRCPGVLTIAEESTAWEGVTRPTAAGGLGFDFKWNMGWMHDTLGYMRRDPVHRPYHHHALTFGLTYAYAEDFVLPLSHDELVHGKGSLAGKMPGDEWQRLANLRAYLAFMWAHPGKKLLFMGQEFAQRSEWSHDRELDWALLRDPRHKGVRDLVRDLNRRYAATPALWRLDCSPGGFSWIDADDAGSSVYSFVRWDRWGAPLVCVSNLSPAPRHGHRLALPSGGRWHEVLNTDAACYGGGNLGNLGSVTGTSSDGGAVAEVLLPPLATLWLVPGEEASERQQ
ncbi:1,4-alpha-glucan branching protein GlgB [Nonomuraea sp. NPDC005692]|uniref:1,4-alpha-glucan branching protein GlgB n=1 Tax=Nonomuraea sp. NPDC005692 TaxID=3157168 RepID=UPI0033E1253A